MSTNEETKKLLKLVNSSGFPFQLRVAREVANSKSHRPWKVVTQEHPWHDADTGREGYIDLVISSYDVQQMVVECKRTKEADWVFLIPTDDGQASGTHVRCAWIDAPQNASSMSLDIRCHHFYAYPESLISEFCVVRGTGEGQKPMLENLCGQLLNSAECLAREELSLAVANNRSIRRLYVPLIVTNAQLSICRFDTSSLSLQDGEIPEGDFEEVPYIRFRKSLTTKLTTESNPDTLERANIDRLRTVFVVQASHLLSFLGEWRLNRNESLPWA